MPGMNPVDKLATNEKERPNRLRFSRLHIRGARRLQSDPRDGKKYAQEVIDKLYKQILQFTKLDSFHESRRFRAIGFWFAALAPRRFDFRLHPLS